MKQTNPYIVLAGAAPDTGNHGVTALAQSAVCGMHDRGFNHFTIFDNGTGTRHRALTGWPEAARTEQLGFRPGKRIFESSNMHNARLRQRLGLPSQAVQKIKGAAAVLDVSGGDSFTDMYGSARFEQIILPKMMTLDSGTPLVLLPQTYGPFNDPWAAQMAKEIISRADLAYARDIYSFRNLKKLLGDKFDSKRHRLGVDLAFGLPMDSSSDAATDQPIGLNVSGLLWNDPNAAERFDLMVDYKKVMKGFVEKILNHSTKNILLVPHVTPAAGESDILASVALKQSLPKHMQARVRIARNARTPSQLKGVIASCSWFAGARMHATIAALSTCTPVANMAYSDKSLGVFEACGAQDSVIDMRAMSTDAMINELCETLLAYKEISRSLCENHQLVQQRWSNQMDTIANFVKTHLAIRSKAYA